MLGPYLLKEAYFKMRDHLPDMAPCHKEVGEYPLVPFLEYPLIGIYNGNFVSGKMSTAVIALNHRYLCS